MQPEEIEEIEIQLLLDALRLRYGYDFRNYAPASLRRRIAQCLSHCEFSRISEIIPRLLYDGWLLERLIGELSVTVTEMFRDPVTFSALTEKVFPILATHSFVNIWHAGCATGEECYSLAILLSEHQLHHRCRIYATDINPEAIEKAREGIYPLERMRTFSSNYHKAGGRGSLADYYHAHYDMACMDPQLRAHMVFATHNLATDGVFAEMNLILCRNVLIYFDPSLQKRVLALFHQSLMPGGLLCLGDSEGLHGSRFQEQFASLGGIRSLYRRS